MIGSFPQSSTYNKSIHTEKNVFCLKIETSTYNCIASKLKLLHNLMLVKKRQKAHSAAAESGCRKAYAHNIHCHVFERGS